MYTYTPEMISRPSTAPHSVRPANVVTLEGLGSCCGLPVPGVGSLSGVGALSLPTSALGLAGLALGGLVLFKLFRRGRGAKQAALRKASYEAAAKRYSILARS